MHISVGVRRIAAEAAFVALLLGMLLAQLDATVVVAALPAIAGDLGEPAALGTVTAVYLLTVTVGTPVHGRLGDLLGRRAVFAGSLLLFALGSALCALAPSFPVLVGARAVQGLGGGGLVVTAVTGLGELFGPAERVRRQIWVTAVFAIGALAGPPLGAVLAAGPGWRWVFLVNLPLCALAFALGARGLPGRSPRATPGFDWPGAALVVTGGGCVVLLGSAGPSTVLLLTGAIAAGLLFVRVERRASTPLVPPALFARPGLARTIVVTGLGGVALFGCFPFVPLVVAAATGADTTAVGAFLVALTGGQLLVGVVFSILARRWPRMVPWGRLGLLLGVLGLPLLATSPLLTGPGAVAAAVLGMALTGAALGLCLQAYTLLGQACAPPDAFGAAMATLTFARQLGGALGAAGLGLVLSGGAGPSVALAVAAVVLLGALAVAPRRRDELAR